MVNKSHFNQRFILFFLFFCTWMTKTHALSDLLVTDPATVYIQWLEQATDPITEADGSNAMSFNSYIGGAATQLSSPSAKELFIGVMCNRIAGYTITLTASNSGATATTAKMTIPGGSHLSYTANLSKVSGSFAAGSNTNMSLDLTGASVSASANFASNDDLPLTTIAPNVWKITTSLPSIDDVTGGLIPSGTYQGGITAVISLQ